MQKQRFVLGFLAGIIATLIAVVGDRLVVSKAGYLDYREQLASHENIPLTALAVPASWLISGSPTFRANTFGYSRDYSSSSGIWECTGPGEFVWHYPADETIYILEGSAEIDYLGKKFTLNPGDSTHFAAGTVSHWVVHDRIKKTWAIYEPGRLVRAMRRLLGGTVAAGVE